MEQVLTCGSRVSIEQNFRISKGIHLDHGVNPGHVTRKFFGAMQSGELHVTDYSEIALLPAYD